MRFSYWRRLLDVSKVMAQEGLSTRLDIQLRMDSRESTMRNWLNELEHAALVTQQVHTLIRSSKLALCSLTDKGKRLCRYYGWDPVVSDWEKLIESHQGHEFWRHTVYTLAFCYQARLRGHRPVVMPLGYDRHKPDVHITDPDGLQHYVEIESRGDRMRGLSLLNDGTIGGKWPWLANIQGFAAVCVPTVYHREKIEDWLYNNRINGLTADLETLIKQSKDDDPGYLWCEEWRHF